MQLRDIPIYWKQAQVPTKEEWFRKVKEIIEAEEWVTTCMDRHEFFSSIWAAWLEYTSDPDQVSSSLDVALLELAEPTLKVPI